MSKGKISIVGTPIGNLEDMTFRALRILKESDIILCEDTRVTKKLLFHFEITEKTLWAYDEHLHDKVFLKVGEALEQGRQISLVSDAGMPGISDPGSYLIKKIREEYPNTPIEVVGGPTALTNALALSGVDTTHGFWFAGFAPHKKGRETLFKKCIEVIANNPVVLYESSHRIEKLVEWFQNNSIHDRLRIGIARELTKLHEEYTSGTPDEIADYLRQPHKIQGEFVTILYLDNIPHR